MNILFKVGILISFINGLSGCFSIPANVQNEYGPKTQSVSVPQDVMPINYSHKNSNNNTPMQIKFNKEYQSAFTVFRNNPAAYYVVSKLISTGNYSIEALPQFVKSNVVILKNVCGKKISINAEINASESVAEPNSKWDIAFYIREKSDVWVSFDGQSIGNFKAGDVRYWKLTPK